jgi:hypothetical protein
MTPAQYNEYQRQADVIEQAKKWKEEQERKQMTSIEWLVNVVQSCIAPNYIPKEIIDQAKEMHKKEIVTAFDEAQEYEYQYHINNAPKFDSETYYNETFKNKLK